VKELSKKSIIILFAAGIIIIPVLLSPLPEFDDPLSTVVEARDGTLLGARIASDGQWRFPAGGAVPEKFRKAILSYEDRYFYFHPGVNPVALLRALAINLKNHEIRSGGSTISMQVARLSGGNRPRTYIRKTIEIFSALKLELLRSKMKILELYTANAPFGGNIVGLDAAAWRYTGKLPSDITWAEAATLAVLPNSPALIFPGRNQEILRKKRDDLLRRLYERNYIDSLTFGLALEEPLLSEPVKLPSAAPHLTDYFYVSRGGERIRTTIDFRLQERTSAIMEMHQKKLEGNLIFNSAVLVVSVESGEVLAYVGNSTAENALAHGGDVDIVRALRSTGSILKPLLYAAMQESGDLLPNTLVPDTPTRFPGFTPENFDRSYSGAVTAGTALSQSLNIPSVRMLLDYSPERFLVLLKETGFTTLSRSSEHYGLSLILGGGETSLWELTGVYASLSRILRKSGNREAYSRSDFHPPVLIPGDEKEHKKDAGKAPLSAASVWLTYEALQNVNRPESEAGWHYFASSRNLAWKTGTSFGFRDAWAVGSTPGYVIGVWAGNADGEGRPGLTGITAAAPILFDIAGIMETVPWFSPPREEMTNISVCSKSGYRAGPDCPDTREVPVCINGLKSSVCPFHKIVHLNRSRTLQVTTDCIPPSEIINESWFVLPPAMEYFYKKKHSDYITLPPFAEGCGNEKGSSVMEFIYPSPGIKIFIPRDFTGELTRIVAEVVHRNASRRIFWHLDDKYLGTTRNVHQIEVLTNTGNHTLTVVDEDGNRLSSPFTIIGKN
jgi:penicillin-binding protein 1C